MTILNLAIPGLLAAILTAALLAGRRASPPQSVPVRSRRDRDDRAELARHPRSTATNLDRRRY